MLRLAKNHNRYRELFLIQKFAGIAVFFAFDPVCNLMLNGIKADKILGSLHAECLSQAIFRYSCCVIRFLLNTTGFFLFNQHL